MKNNKKKFHGRKNDDRLKVKPEKKSKKELDPNRPRRPQSPFFIFLDQFRREFNEANPDNKSVSVVGRAAGKKWKKMTEEEKEPFAAIAKSKKAEYAINIQQYNMQLANGTNTTTDGTKTTGDDDSDKPKSEVNDEKESGSKEEKDEVKEVGP